jgi:hypothetical protein
MRAEDLHELAKEVVLAAHEANDPEALHPRVMYEAGARAMLNYAIGCIISSSLPKGLETQQLLDKLTIK